MQKARLEKPIIDYILIKHKGGFGAYRIATSLYKDHRISRSASTVRRMIKRPEKYIRTDAHSIDVEININDAIQLLSEIKDPNTFQDNYLIKRMLNFLQAKDAEDYIIKYGEKGMKLGKYLSTHTDKYHKQLEKYPDYILDKCCEQYLEKSDDDFIYFL